MNEREQMGALLATTEKIVRITSRGQVYEQVYLPQDPSASLDSIQQSLESALTQIYTSSLDLLAESGKLFSSGAARRTLEAIVHPGKMSGSLADLGAQEDELLRDTQACESRRSAEADDRMIKMLQAFNDPLNRMDEGISHLLEHMNQSDRIEMLEWISPVPFGKHHDNVKRKGRQALVSGCCNTTTSVTGKRRNRLFCSGSRDLLVQARHTSHPRLSTMPEEI